MRTENGFQVDLNAVEEVLGKSDVLTIGFTLFPERLLIDVRGNANEGQFAGMVEPVATVQERYLWLGRQRGSLGAPEAFSFFIWPQTVQGLVEGNVLAPLFRRLGPQGREQLDGALGEALALEQNAIRDAVRGAEGWPSIWEAPARRRGEQR